MAQIIFELEDPFQPIWICNKDIEPEFSDLSWLDYLAIDTTPTLPSLSLTLSEESTPEDNSKYAALMCQEILDVDQIQSKQHPAVIQRKLIFRVSNNAPTWMKDIGTRSIKEKNDTLEKENNRDTSMSSLPTKHKKKSPKPYKKKIKANINSSINT